MYNANLAEKSSITFPTDYSKITAFCPDLIIEVTSICDRACQGCYANNIISHKSKSETLQRFPNLFLDSKFAEKFFSGLELIPESISLRGGEPTRHPMLSKIIADTYLYTEAKLYLETHGRWLLEGANQELLNTLRSTRSTVKISFDKMHEISKSSLREITSALECAGVEFIVAITEENALEFAESRAKCDWIPETKIVYQKKAKDISELPKPPLGVLSCTGILSGSLNTKAGYKGSK